MHHAQQAYDHLLAARLPRARARALHALGSYHSRLASHEQALACWQAALVLRQEARDHRYEAETLDRLGSAHHQLGDHRQAASCYQRAIRGYRSLGRSYEQARTLEQLGDLQLAARGPARRLPGVAAGPDYPGPARPPGRRPPPQPARPALPRVGWDGAGGLRRPPRR